MCERERRSRLVDELVRVIGERSVLPRRLEEIVQETAARFSAATCLIALSNSSTVSYAVRHGCALEGVPRQSCCSLTVNLCERDLPTIVCDAAKDPRFDDDRLVRQGARFYAGAPIVVNHDQNQCFLGCLCIIDPSPRSEFSLRDADPLVRATAEISQILEQVIVDSLGSPNSVQAHSPAIRAKAPAAAWALRVRSPRSEGT